MLHHDKRKSKSKFFILIVVSIFLIYFITRPASVQLFSQMLAYIIEPISRVGADSVEATVKTGSFFSDKEKLIDENIKLKEDILSLSLKLIDSNFLWEENRELKKLLGRGDMDNRLLASVLTNPSVSPYGTVLLDVGTDDGVVVGNKVVKGQIVLGEIIALNKSSALMMPLSTSGEITNAFMSNKDIIPVVVTGRGGGNYIIELPRDAVASVGDIVTLAGLNSLIVGTVEHVAIQPNDPFKHILFKSPVSLFSTRYVEIILGTDELLSYITNDISTEEND